MLIYDLLDFTKNTETEYSGIVNSMKFDLGGISLISKLSDLSKEEFYELPYETCLFEMTDDEPGTIDKFYVLATDKNDSISAKCFIKYKSGAFDFPDYELFIDKKNNESFHLSIKSQCFIDFIWSKIPEHKEYCCSPLHLVNKYRNEIPKDIELKLRALELNTLETEFDILRNDNSMVKAERRIAYTVIRMLLKSIEIFSCSNVHLQKNDCIDFTEHKISNRKNLPKFSYHTVHINLNKETIKSGVGASKHASPRLHLRRGHIRRLQSGVKVWVTSCLVGDKNKGIVTSEYKIAV